MFYILQTHSIVNVFCAEENKMERSTWILCIICVSAIIVIVVAGVILWQLGFMKSDTKPGDSVVEKPISSISKTTTPTGAAPTLAAVDPTMQSTDVERTITQSIEAQPLSVSEEEILQDFLKRWLCAGTIAFVPLMTPMQTDTTCTFDPHFTDTLMPGVQIESACGRGSMFGQSCDVARDIVVVGAPSIQTMVVYDLVTQKQVIQSNYGKFGYACKLTDDGSTLAVQSEVHISLYIRNSMTQEYVLHSSVDVAPSALLLGFAGNHTLWISDLLHPRVSLVCWTNETWIQTHLSEYEVMVMGMAYDKVNRHVWMATRSGLMRWSQSFSDDTWTQTGTWLNTHPFTTIHQFTPSTGIHVGRSLLLLGQAHVDTLWLVATTDPSVMIDKIEIPGGYMEHRNAMFSDTLMWSETSQTIYVTAPLETNEEGVLEVGAVFMYMLTADLQLIPTGMMHGPKEAASQFGAILKCTQNHVFVSTPGVHGNTGSVNAYELIGT